MAMQRRFGPTRSAGVVVIEKPSEKVIEPGALGVTAYLGILEKGMVGDFIPCPTKKALLKKAGSFVPYSLLPDAAQDFFNLGQGAGELFLLRVTDGSEKQAEITLFNRREPRGEVVKVKAKNGGRWGGKEYFFIADMDNVVTDLTETTLNAGFPLLDVNWFAGGRLRLSGLPGKSYPIIANTKDGLITVSQDSRMLSDLTKAGGLNNKEFSVELENEGKALSILIKHGIETPSTEWGMDVYVDGVLTLQYPNLSSDQASPRYFVNIINTDGNNDEIVVEDLWTGAPAEDVRPANFSGISQALTPTRLTTEVVESVIASPSGANGSLTIIEKGNALRRDTLILSCIDASTPGSELWSVESTSLFPKGGLPNATTGVIYPKKNDYTLSFQVVSGTTPWTVRDKITILINPFRPGALKGGILIPNVNEPRVRFEIIDNTIDSIDIKPSEDMTKKASAGDRFRVEARQELASGYEGIAEIADAHYIQAFDIATSPLNTLFGKNKGLVKIACPGVTSVAIQKAGLAYAEAKNYQFRVEIPDSIVTESDAERFVNEEIGRSDFGVVSFPSYGDVANPQGQGRKRISLTGAIHGREALIARNYNGFHKASAGIDVTLPHVLALPTGERVLDEEALNPQGIGIIKFAKGNAILWGDRTISIDPAWKWKHQREQMSHYENILRESFDFIIFAINNRLAQQLLLTSLRAFFIPEFVKGALRGEDFEDACRIKIDEEINTNLTRAQGDLNAEIALRLADTVERFIITISKMGIFEQKGG